MTLSGSGHTRSPTLQLQVSTQGYMWWLQVVENIMQLLAALQLLVPQADYGAALDVMDDIKVNNTSASLHSVSHPVAL